MLLIFSGIKKCLDRRGEKYYLTVMSIGNLRIYRTLKKTHKTASSAVEYGHMLAERYRRLLAVKKTVI